MQQLNQRSRPFLGDEICGEVHDLASTLMPGLERMLLLHLEVLHVTLFNLRVKSPHQLVHACHGVPGVLVSHVWTPHISTAIPLTIPVSHL